MYDILNIGQFSAILRIRARYRIGLFFFSDRLERIIHNNDVRKNEFII
jgi:hypothetical protein